MNNVIFFAPSTGAPPGIWATGDVNGSYSGIPALNKSVTLNGDGLTADFTPKTWSNEKWLSTVNGDGTLQVIGPARTSPAGYTKPITFSGAAAGTYNGGNFSGTAAGTAK
jgi:hypothetical protein